MQFTILNYRPYRKCIGKGSFGEVYKVKEISTGDIYAAKVSINEIQEDEKNAQNTLFLFREVNLMASLSYPSIIKFIGYSPIDFVGSPKPTIITEYAINGSLESILQQESTGNSPEGWDFTKKLINIYGIAAGMMFIHSKGIIHRDLKTANILLDELLCPRIADFGLAKIFENLSGNSLFQSQKGIKGTICCMAPETLDTEEYTEAGDVYAFALIVYEIMTTSKAFDKMNIAQFITEVVNGGYRPELTEDIPKAYRDLISFCWSERPEKRPTFAQIVEELQKNKDFITDQVDVADFYDYIDYIDSSKTYYNQDRKILFDEFIKKNSKRRGTTIKHVSIKGDVSRKNKFKATKRSRSIFSKKSGKKKDQENDEDIEDQDEFEDSPQSSNKNLSESNQNPKTNIIEAEKMFIIGKNYIEGINCNQDIILGIKYLKDSISMNYFESVIYYCKMLIKGNIIEKDLKRAKEYLMQYTEKNDPRLFLLIGKIFKNERNISKANEYFLKGVEVEDPECLYQYAKMIFEKKKQDAIKFLFLSKKKGFKKSNIFLMIYQELTKFSDHFKDMNSKEQMFFISHYMKYATQQETESNYNKSILIERFKFDENEIVDLFSNQTTNSSTFINFLNNYQIITIDLKYPSDLFAISLHFSSLLQKSLLKLQIIIFAEHVDKKIFQNENINEYKLELSSSLTTIENGAFDGCFSLTQISIPSSITLINDYAFNGCSSLTKIIIPSSVISIGSFAFRGCSSLTEISIPSSVSIIKNSTFYECTSLVQISIPSTLKSIEKFAFGQCSSLKQIKIPSVVTVIDIYSFAGCSSLIEVTIPSSVTSIEKFAFSECSSLKKISFTSSLKSIGSHAFKGCTSLVQIIIPSSVTSIEDNAFTECSSLRQIIFPISLKFIGRRAFCQCSSLTEILIPSSIVSIKDNTFNGCSSLKQILIPSSVKSIEDSAFSECKSLTEIKIPSSVKTIGEYSFNKCTSLMQLTMNIATTKFSLSTFNECQAINHFVVDSSATMIPRFNFSYFKHLTTITIPSSITFIGKNAFRNFSSIKKIEIPTSVKLIGENAFCECSSLINITIPPSVTSIGKSSFSKCSSIKQINIPSSVVSIGDEAFNECISLTELAFDEQSSLASIGSLAFALCSSLKQVIIPSSVKSIGHHTFCNCFSLEKIMLPEKLIKIEDGIFSNCESLHEISIPSFVTSIGINAFLKCKSLQKIELPTSILTIGNDAFNGFSSIASISLQSTTFVGERAFCGCSSIVSISI